MNKRWAVFAAGLALGFGVALLVPKLTRRSPPEETAAQGKAIYQCPMHPSVVSDKPGTCPICGMKLQKMDQSQQPRSPVSGHAVVQLPKWRQQLIGVTTAEAQRRPLTVSIRTVGKIAYDPDLYTAITEYREALISRDKVKDSAWPDVHEQADALVRAAALKLKLMGLSEDQVAKLSAEGSPTNLLFGTAGGTLWVYADIYENDVGLVAAGQEVAVTLPAFPGQVFAGSIKAIDPVLDPRTRTVRARAEIQNVSGRLKPEMFVNVAIKVPLGTALAVPVDAVLDTGTRKLVFVEIGDGEFDPREVKVGHLAGDDYEILSGLKPGERVVTQANFLIDSESKLRATGQKAAGAMPGMSMPGDKK